MQLLLFSSVVVVYENTSAICVVVGFHAVRFFLAFSLRSIGFHNKSCRVLGVF